MAVLKRVDVQNALLVCLLEKPGGKAKAEDVEEPIVLMLHVSEADLRLKVGDGRSSFKIRVETNAALLKQKGLLHEKEISRRGYWQLTPKGRRAANEALGKSGQSGRGYSEQRLKSRTGARARRVPNTDDVDAAGEPAREAIRKGWKRKESEWHKRTVKDVFQNPTMVEVESASILHRWMNSCATDDDGSPLWRRLLTLKRPDVVFELLSGAIVIVEVEPYATRFDGIGQLVGDYMTNLLVDRRSTGVRVPRAIECR
jgi:hypothetical protein